LRFGRRNPNRIRRPQPDFIEPEKALLVDKPPPGDGWLHEIKIDGYRAAAVISNGQVRMFSRNANDWTEKFDPPPRESGEAEGEIRVPRRRGGRAEHRGISDFEALQEAMGRARNGTLSFIVFDILKKNGKDLRDLPLIERKAILEKLLAKPPAGTSSARGRSSSEHPASAIWRE
jgi:bifunctional non-homologous end joining protein LigD